MKIMHKIAWALILPAVILFLLGGAAALFLLWCWPLSGSAESAEGHTLLLVLFIAVLCGVGCGLVAIWVLLHRVLGPLLAAERFASRMAAGEYPAPLELGRRHGDEVRSLFSALNCLRDRICSLSGKLKNGLRREINFRKEIERYDALQLHLLSRGLPDSRRAIGIVKAYAMAIQLREAAKTTPDAATLADLKALRLRLNAFAVEIEQLFDLSRLERDRWQHPVETDFFAGEFTRDLVNRCSIPLRSRGVNLETGFSGRTPERLRGDRELLFRLLNILIRAIGRSAGYGGTITFTSDLDGEQVFFEIRDSRAIPCRENLAESFAELNQNGPERFAYPPDAGVSVLSLGIVRDVARSIGCELQVSADENSWTCLRFLLPTHCFEVARTDSFTVNFRSPAAIPSDNGEPALPSGVIQEGLRVLVLDDDQEEAAVYARVLLAHGINCTLAVSRQDLTKKLDSISCDAVILVEPDQDPEEFPEELRHISGKRNLPVIVIASQFSEEDFRKFLNHGRVWCLTMPPKFQLLCGILHKAVGK